MNTARDNILGRVRKSLGKRGRNAADLTAAEAYVAQHQRGPIPATSANLVEHFMRRACDMASTVEALGSRAEIPQAVARYLATAELPKLLAGQPVTQGVCWPEFADLDWAAAGLQIAARATQGQDKLGITGAFCGVAETGTLVVVSGRDTPSGTTLLPDTHVAVVRSSRIVGGMEDAFALIRNECEALPRAVSFISGPSRTADIEQTIVLGAHGPYRVHVIVVSD
jgi:L-lactate dehydrogenase complex protein LldG